MHIDEVTCGRTCLLILHGRLDASTCERLAACIEARVAAGWSRLVLDCGALVEVTSVGLRVLLVGAKQTRAAGGLLACCALQPVVREVFELSRFGTVLEVHADRAAALGALA